MHKLTNTHKAANHTKGMWVFYISAADTNVSAKQTDVPSMLLGSNCRHKCDINPMRMRHVCDFLSKNFTLVTVTALKFKYHVLSLTSNCSV